MKRTFLRLTVLAAAAVALSGCSTFSDNDLAARVDDDELTNDQLTAIAREQLGDEEAVRADSATVATILNNWVLDRVLRADLAANGTPLDEVDGELTNDTLNASINTSFEVWQQTQPPALDTAVIAARYELGPVESNLICPAHVLVEEESTADEVLDELAGGATFADVAAEFSIDGSAQDGGNLPCGTTEQFTSQYIPEFVEAALDADIGVAIGPVESQFGFHVILLRPFDDLAAGELDLLLASPQIRFERAITDLDIYVDPRYGAFDGTSGVVPLG